MCLFIFHIFPVWSWHRIRGNYTSLRYQTSPRLWRLMARDISSRTGLITPWDPVICGSFKKLGRQTWYDLMSWIWVESWYILPWYPAVISEQRTWRIWIPKLCSPTKERCCTTQKKACSLIAICSELFVVFANFAILVVQPLDAIGIHWYPLIRFLNRWVSENVFSARPYGPGSMQPRYVAAVAVIILHQGGGYKACRSTLWHLELYNLLLYQASTGRNAALLAGFIE